jgi:hypothetical protein
MILPEPIAIWIQNIGFTKEQWGILGITIFGCALIVVATHEYWNLRDWRYY